MTPKMRFYVALQNFGRGIKDKGNFQMAIENGRVDKSLFEKLIDGEEILYTADQISDVMIYRWCRSGVIPNAFKVGKRWFIPKSDMDSLLIRKEKTQP